VSLVNAKLGISLTDTIRHNPASKIADRTTLLEALLK
jgi:hypothetical protein